MTTATIRQPRSSLSMLSLVVAGAAVAVAVAAIATDDVSSRPSQIVVAPLDENHPAAAPRSPVSAGRGTARREPSGGRAGERSAGGRAKESLPFIPYEDELAEDESLPFIPYLPQAESVMTGAPVARG